LRPASRSSEDADDDMEGVGAFEPCGVDGRPDVAFSFGGPHGSISVGDLSLDHTRSEFAFGRVVGWVDLTGIIAEDQPSP